MENKYNYLTDLEKTKIEFFCADEVMFEAVRKVMLQGLYLHDTVGKDFTPDPLVNGAFHLASLALNNPIPDAEVGANVRAMFAGVNALKNAVDDLKSIKTPKADLIESPYNEAE